MKLKKTVYTLSVDNYAPELTELTFPLIQMYAEKIGAEFKVIKERKYPDMPPIYEKMQLFELSKENDWTIYLDADTLIHPDFPDVTVLLNKDTVAFHGADFAPVRWRYNNDFLRDGRNIGACNWFAVASDWCSDLWHPLTIPFKEAVINIFPTVCELTSVVKREHLIDDYLLSWNIARYGLKHTLIQKKLMDVGFDTRAYLYHEYTKPIEEKRVFMEKMLQNWRIKCEV